MSSAIPKPPVPQRPRRSSIAQAAQTEGETGQGYESAQAGTEPAPPAIASVPPAPRPASTAPSTTNSKRLGGNSRDLLLTLPEEEKDRMVNTVTWSAPHTGIKHQSKFIRYAIARLCEDLETKFNKGEAFPPPAISDM